MDDDVLIILGSGRNAKRAGNGIVYVQGPPSGPPGGYQIVTFIGIGLMTGAISNIISQLVSDLFGPAAQE